jgi:hypothetical protein
MATPASQAACAKGDAEIEDIEKRLVVDEH